MATQPLIHNDPTLSSEQLTAEANEYLNRHPAYIFISALIKETDITELFWSAEEELTALPIADRFMKLDDRPDIRGTITHKSTGLFPTIAFAMPFETQAQLLETAISSKMLQAKDILIIFRNIAPIVYFDVSIYWQLITSKLDTISADDLRLLYARILEACLDSNLLSHWDVRMALRHAWHMYVPIEMREKVDLIRLEQERKNPRIPFTAKQELEIITPDIILQDLPADEFKPVLEAIAKKLDIDSKVAPPKNLLEDLELESLPSSRPDELKSGEPDGTNSANQTQESFPKE